MTASKTTLNDFSDTYFNKFKYRDKAELSYNPNLKKHYARTIPSKINDKYPVEFAPKAFKSKFTLFLTMEHEYVHVGQLANGLIEAGALKWEANIMKASGMERYSEYGEAIMQLNNHINSFPENVQSKVLHNLLF